MNKIRFTHNWNNKLNCNFFTTIRNYTPEKFGYYSDQLNKKLDVWLKDKGVISKAELIDINHLDYCDIPHLVLFLDTGMFNLEKIFNLFKKFGMRDAESRMIILTFKRIIDE